MLGLNNDFVNESFDTINFIQFQIPFYNLNFIQPIMS